MENKEGPVGHKPARMAVELVQKMAEEGLTYYEAESVINDTRLLLKGTRLTFENFAEIAHGV